MNLEALKSIYLSELDQSSGVKNIELLKRAGELRYRFLNEGFNPEEGPPIRRHIQPTTNTIYLEADQSGKAQRINESQQSLQT